ncbi:MAG TPA: hypothetical protein ENG63_04345 [Candidatus Desulfofervidus auxilii]|uniref:DUF481 domain-containing protein n=1 Tax=Desulfofervidus auxilii TaxID=1621989 RepID=A0A7C0U2B7_DESA2|nr:hypothetical protein [Candidatus Desulfofervidus auxilii]
MEGHTGIFAINYLFSKKLNFSISSAYTDSKAHMERIELDGPTAATQIDNGTNGFSRDYNYDFSEVQQYSDLHIRELDLACSISYQINKHFSLNVEYNYLYYGDAKPYLYDGTGRAHIGIFTLSYWQ